MKQCPSCKRTYDDATAFCKECGIALGAPVNPAMAGTAPAMNMNAIPMNEHKEWCFKTDWGGTGYKITNIVANGPIMEFEMYKQYVIKLGKQRVTVDAREITDVHIKKNIQITSVLMILCGILALINTSSTIWAIALIVVGAICIKNKYYVITHRRGTVTIPLFNTDSEDGKDFLNYITKYSPYAVKTDLSLGR